MFAKNETGYRKTSNLIRWWSLLILLLSKFTQLQYFTQIVWVMFNCFLILDATDRNMVRRDQSRIQFDFNFSRTLPLMVFFFSHLCTSRSYKTFGLEGSLIYITLTVPLKFVLLKDIWIYLEYSKYLLNIKFALELP